MTMDDADRQQVSTMIQAALASQSAGVNGLTRNGVVQSYDPPTRVAQTLLDGDKDPVPVQSIQGLALEVGQRVVVMFQEPSGAVVIGYAGDPLVPATVTVQAKTTLTFTAPDIYDAGPWHIVPGGVGFQNGWGDFGAPFPTVQYRKRGRMIDIVGVVAGGTINLPVFTLPAEYRPLSNRTYITTASGSSFAQVVIIAATGQVNIPNGSTVATSLFVSYAIT